MLYQAQQVPVDPLCNHEHSREFGNTRAWTWILLTSWPWIGFKNILGILYNVCILSLPWFYGENQQELYTRNTQFGTLAVPRLIQYCFWRHCKTGETFFAPLKAARGIFCPSPHSCLSQYCHPHAKQKSVVKVTGWGNYICLYVIPPICVRWTFPGDCSPHELQ